MADSSTDASSSSPNKTQILINTVTLEEDERNCIFVVLHNVYMLQVYSSAQIALALETFYT